MKILFVMRHSGYVRNFESTLRSLSDRGHQVHLGFQVAERHALLDPRDATGTLIATYDGLEQSPAPGRPTALWSLLGGELRLILDYFRYLEPRYRDAPKLRARVQNRVLAPIRILAPRIARLPGGLSVLRALFSLAERSVPRSAEVDAFLLEHKPDVMLVTPLVETGSPQSDFMISARALGIRTGLCVASWDNLTNKGLIRETPDLVTVWNEAMRQEAIELHGVPPERVVVTGAPAYDHWFDWQPSLTREAFCAQVGLPADRPYVLYLCSSKFIAPEEVPFVRKWLAQLRAHPDKRLREAGVLIRLHPQNAAQWVGVELGEYGAVSIWPPGGANPVDIEGKSAFYDSMFHSAAVMGVNTSALIESGIVGRPVYTLLAPEFRDTQEGTLHFQHLLHVNGGLLRVAETFDEHAQQLLAALTADAAEQAREVEHNRRFIEAFVRPFGLQEPSTPRLVEAIEGLGRQPAPEPVRQPMAYGLVRTLLSPALIFAFMRRRAILRGIPRSFRAPTSEISIRERARHLLVGKAEPLDPARFASAYRQVRQQLPGAEADARSATELLGWLRERRRELLPAVPVGRAPAEQAIWNLTERSADPLVRLYGNELVPLPPVMDSVTASNADQARHVLGALRGFEAFLALDQGEVLAGFRRDRRKQVVWQIGGDGGYLACGLAGLRRGVTMVIVDHPEHLLAAAAYLKTAMPDACIRFAGDNADVLGPETEETSLLFVPLDRLQQTELPKPGLTMIPGGCAGLSTAELECALGRAYELGSVFAYGPAQLSLDGQANEVDLQEIIGRYYWPHMFLLMPDKAAGVQRRAAKEAGLPPSLFDSAHVIGWRRIQV